MGLKRFPASLDSISQSEAGSPPVGETQPMSLNDASGESRTLSVEQAAKRLGASPNHIRVLIRNRRLRAKRRGGRFLIRPADLSAVQPPKIGRPQREPSARYYLNVPGAEGYAGSIYFQDNYALSNQELRSLVKQGFVKEKSHPQLSGPHGGPRLYCVADVREWKRLSALAAADTKRHYLNNLATGYAGPAYFSDKYDVGNSTLLAIAKSKRREVGHRKRPVVSGCENPPFQIPSPVRRGFFLYHIGQFGEWHANRADDLPGYAFSILATRESFLWMGLLKTPELRSKYHTTTGSLYEWEDPNGPGCAPLGGEHPRILRLRQKQNGNKHSGRLARDYVPFDFLDRMIEPPKKLVTPSTNNRRKKPRKWLTLKQVEDHGMSRTTARRYADIPEKSEREAQR